MRKRIKKKNKLKNGMQLIIFTEKQMFRSKFNKKCNKNKKIVWSPLNNKKNHKLLLKKLRKI